MQGAERPRLEALDGLRGIAALAVVLWHVHLYALLDVRPFVTHAYLAIDLFFMISGFILAHAYGETLERAEGLGRFLRARLVRLYPLHAAGAALGLAVFLAARPAEAAWIGDGGFGLLLALAAAFLPWVLGGAGGLNAFPLNPPSWSLSLEMWGNLLFGVFARRLSPPVLAACMGAGAVALVAVALAGHGLNYGWRQGDVWLGWPRFVFAFSAGLCLHRLWAAGRLRLPRLPDWSLALVLAAVLTLPDAGGFNGVLDLMIVLLVFPPLVALAVGARSSPLWGGPLAVGARLSYPLYATHAAVVAIVRAAAESLGAPAAGPLVAAVALTASIAAAWAAERFFDRPVRAWLAPPRPVPASAVFQPAA